MPAGLTAALILLAQSSSHPVYGPVAAVPPKPATAPTPERECVNQNKDPSGNEIVVCAVKPEGYRLPPDIVEARRLKKKGLAGPPRNPHETFADNSCAHVGPAPCATGPAINLLGVAMVAAEISKRLAKGQEIGSIFQTETAKGDYQYYLEAKAEREAKEAAAAAAAAKAKAQAAPANATPQPQPAK